MGRNKTSLTPENLEDITQLVKSGVTSKYKIYHQLKNKLGMSQSSFHRKIEDHADSLGLPQRKSHKQRRLERGDSSKPKNLVKKSVKNKSSTRKIVTGPDIDYAIGCGARTIEDVSTILNNVPGFSTTLTRVRVVVNQGDFTFSNFQHPLLYPSEYITNQIAGGAHTKCRSLAEYRISLVEEGILPDTCNEKMFRDFIDVSTLSNTNVSSAPLAKELDTLTIRKILTTQSIASAKDLAQKADMPYESLRRILSNEDELSDLLEMAKEDSRTAPYKKAIQDNPHLNNNRIAIITGTSRSTFHRMISRDASLATFFEETRRINRIRQRERAKLLAAIKNDARSLVDFLRAHYVAIAADNNPFITQEAIAIANEYKRPNHGRGRSFLDLVGPVAMVLRRNSGEDLNMQQIADACGIGYRQVNTIISRTGLSEQKKHCWFDLPSYGPAIKRAINVEMSIASLIDLLSIPVTTSALNKYVYGKGVRCGGKTVSFGNIGGEAAATYSEHTISEIYRETDNGEDLQKIAGAYEIPLSIVEKINRERSKYADPITTKLQSVFMHPTWDKPYVTDELRDHLAKVDAFYEARPTGEKAIFDLEEAIEYAEIDASLASLLDTNQARKIYEPDLNAA